MIGILTLLLVPSLFILSLLDVSLRSVNYYRIHSIYRHGNKNAQKLFSLLSSPERAISVLLFLRYTLTALLFVLCGLFLHQLHWSWPYTIGLAVGLILGTLVLVEYMPRMLGTQNPERIAFTLVKPFQFALKLNQLLPLPQVVERLTSKVLKLYGINARKIFSKYSVNEIKMFLSVKDVEGEQKPQSIGTKLVDFTARRVREVMVPRPFVKAVEVNTPLRNLIRIIHENGYSRMPVYRSDFDNALGILHVKDIIGLSEPFWLEQHLRKPFFIPETATVQAAFQNMQRNHVQLALVVDEYGGVDGIVSMEDLIEELIGEIQDEYDEEVQMLQRISERHWILEGNATLKEVNGNLNIDLPENSSYTTIAGFLISILDRIPAEKDEIRYGDLLFTIEKMVGYKISKISVHLPQPAETATEQTR